MAVKDSTPLNAAPAATTAATTAVANLTLDNSNLDAAVSLSVEIRNTGAVAGDEVVLGYWRPAKYVHPVNQSFMRLQRQVFDFDRVSALAPSQQAVVTLTLSVDDLVLIDKDGNRVSRPGQYELIVSRGASEPEVTVGLTLTGVVRVLETMPPAPAPPAQAEVHR
jgi:hypothetical protein